MRTYKEFISQILAAAKPFPGLQNKIKAAINKNHDGIEIDGFKAPELMLELQNGDMGVACQCINDEVPKDPQNPDAVHLYAVVMDKTDAEAKKVLEKLKK